MRDLKFDSAQLDRSFQGLHQKVSGGLVAAAKIFEANIERVINSHDALPLMLEHSAALEAAFATAAKEPEAEGIRGLLFNPSDVKNREMAEMKDFADNVFLKEAATKHLKSRLDIGRGNYVSCGAHRIQNVLGWFDEETLTHGIESLLESMVISAWTAVEMCIESIWDESAKSPTIKNPYGEGDRISKLYSLNSGCPILGNLPKKGKASLKSMNAVRTVFSYGFGIDSTDIDNAVADESLEALSLLRNLLVHDNGMIDPDFAYRASFVSTLKHITAPRFEVDGEIAKTVINAALTTVSDLLLSVDRWLKAHP